MTPRFVFFAGKGGVGKTTCSAAWAVGEAELGQRVLVVSTDPAHSLGDALGLKLSSRRQPVPVKRGSLYALELDAPKAMERWLRPRRALLEQIALRGTYLDSDDVKDFLRLSIPGVDELLSLLELMRLSDQQPYECVAIDTAPTGHMLRLLEMPQTLKRFAQVLDDMQAKHRAIAEALGGWQSSDPAEALIGEIESDGERLEAWLSDRDRAEFHWVLLPESLSVSETKNGLAALRQHRAHVVELIVNRVTPPPPGPCALCSERQVREREAVEALLEAEPGVPIRLVTALEEEPRGVPALRRIAAALADPARGKGLLRSAGKSKASRRRTAKATEHGLGFPLEVPPSLRLLMFGGKGGVGKSTCSAAAAIELARRRPSDSILLLSTDPARRMGDVLGLRLAEQDRLVPGAPRNLRAREIDANSAFARERERYRRSVDDLFDALRGGSRMDAPYDRAIVQDLIELSPPGLDELFGLFSVLDALFPVVPSAPAGADLVVVDTAPTGHALRLLQTPKLALEWSHALLRVLLKYRGAVSLGALAEDLLAVTRQIKQLQTLLGDATRARFVVVTRAAELPVRESMRLMRGLKKLHIRSMDLLINAVTPPDCKRCRRLAGQEALRIATLRHAWVALRPLGGAVIFAPARATPPRGAESLMHFADTWAR